MTLNAIGYVRVSTDQQGESGAGLDAQRAKIHEEVERRGWSFLTMYVDVASGKSTKGRPDLEVALDILASGEADVLVVAKLDRLSRSMLDFAGIIAKSRAQDWSLVAIDLGVDTTTTNGKLIAHIVMALAEWERELIGDRTRDALKAVRARGTRLGRPPTVSSETTGMILALRGTGKGFGAIARTLNEQSIPTGQGGAKWHASTVRGIVQRSST